MIYIVDNDRDSTLIHKIDTENGVYLSPRRIRGLSFDAQARKLISLVEEEKPSQIIFDKMGYGKGLWDTFITEMRPMRALFDIDSKGNITHIEV